MTRSLLPAQGQALPQPRQDLNIDLTLPVTRVGFGPIALLCRAPHKNDYAEPLVMRSCGSRIPRWTMPAPLGTPHNDVATSTGAVMGGAHA